MNPTNTERRCRIFDDGTVVAEHHDAVYLAFASQSGGAALHSPRHALEIAAEIMEAASRVIERQFQRQLGSP